MFCISIGQNPMFTSLQISDEPDLSMFDSYFPNSCIKC